MNRAHDETAIGSDSLVEVARVDQVPPGTMKEARLRNRPIVVANVHGRLVAFQNRCLHYGIRLSDGVLAGSVLTCRWHQWRYDVCTGRMLTEESPYETFLTYPVIVQDDIVYVDPSPITRLRRRPDG